MQNTVCQWQCYAVREFRNPCRNYENAELMMWAKAQRQMTETMADDKTINKAYYKEVTVCRNDL